MKNVTIFLSEIFPFLEVKFSIYLNRRVFGMKTYEYVSEVKVKIALSRAMNIVCVTILSHHTEKTFM